MASSRAKVSPSVRAIGRRRRALAAFLLGAALSAVGVGAFLASGAAAHGPFTSANPTAFQPSYSIIRLDGRGRAGSENDTRRKGDRERITVVAGQSSVDHPHFSAHGAVCVRLCDGYFFPLDGAAACNSQCPDAPTEIFYRGGSDRIEDSVSAQGRLYSALPVSLRYRKTSNNTCSCHRNAVAYAPMRDATLRHGDAVMTPAGFMVFNGAEGGAHKVSEFAALAQVKMSAQQRAALLAMERASLGNAHPSLQTWLAAQGAPASVASRNASPSLAHASLAEDKIRLLRWRDAED